MEYDVIIIGAGFTGLTAAMKLVESGKRILLIESENVPGGLASTFYFKDKTEVEKFYHHWFNNDKFVSKLVDKLGLKDEVISKSSKTGLYYNKRIWQFSTPLDLLKFSPLNIFDRLRLGYLLIKVKRIKDWRIIEHLSIEEWLKPICGEKVFNIIWKPLIDSKFSIYAKNISAVWMWKKLVLRGGSRKKGGGEELCYFKGGFGRLAKEMSNFITKNGGEIKYSEEVLNVHKNKDKLISISTNKSIYKGKSFLFTPSLPIINKIINKSITKKESSKLLRINYLGNICLVLQLTKSLSNIYWLNVNDPGFPFVGVIEHTNFESVKNYKGRHIVYLSRYIAREDICWKLSKSEYYEYAIKHLKVMFPNFDKKFVIDYEIWRSPYAQPVTEKNYSKLRPKTKLSLSNLYISTMAQIYPEDRGTNYAMRNGDEIAKKIIKDLN